MISLIEILSEIQISKGPKTDEELAQFLNNHKKEVLSLIGYKEGDYIFKSKDIVFEYIEDNEDGNGVYINLNDGNLAIFH